MGGEGHDSRQWPGVTSALKETARSSEEREGRASRQTDSRNRACREGPAGV